MNKIERLIDPMNERVQAAQKERDRIAEIHEGLDPDKDEDSELYSENDDQYNEAQLELNQLLSEREWVLSIIA